jgi:nucleolar pre-ribosomal-associated protein 2
MIGSYTNVDFEGREISRAATYRGREDWLLKWLLKKLQAYAAPRYASLNCFEYHSDFSEFRNTPSSWRLLHYLLQVLSQSTSARALIDRQFTSILRETLEEAQKPPRDIDMVEAPSTSGSEIKEKERPRKPSKKRKHTGELVGDPTSQGSNLPDLIGAIFSAMDLLIQFTKLISKNSKEGRSSAFLAEYMKAVLKTAAKEAATILGSWASLCQNALKNQDLDKKDLQSWLTPFIEIWNTHEIEDTSYMQFSLHCTQPILSLLRTVKEGKYANFDWVPQLEQLISRNIMNPAKTAKWENPESDLLPTLTRITILQDTANASRLFEVAIRSIQPHESRQRRPNDDTWLQFVFKTLKDAMPPQRAESNGTDVGAMLQCAIDHKLNLNLSDLRTITSEYALPEGREDWELLSTIIKLDANVFLISNDDQDLLKELLDRITKISIDDSWTRLCDRVVSDVLVPLMGEFAKARDLSGFLRHWLAQLIEFDRLRNEDMRFSMDFGAWEDDALQVQLSKLLESSLTVQQITQILDWLLTEVTEHPDAVCVILDAIAGSIHHEEVVDAVGLRLYHIMFDSEASEKLEGRYRWRSWRILSRSLGWLMVPDVNELSRLWGLRAKPFRSLSSKSTSNIVGNISKLEVLEVTRLVCAAWNTAEKDSLTERFRKLYALNVLQQLAQDIKYLPGELKGGEDLGSETCGSVAKTLEPGIGWTTWSSCKIVFVEYPRILE